jgi:hypothetical protein
LAFERLASLASRSFRLRIPEAAAAAGREYRKRVPGPQVVPEPLVLVTSQ